MTDIDDNNPPNDLTDPFDDESMGETSFSSEDIITSAETPDSISPKRLSELPPLDNEKLVKLLESMQADKALLLAAWEQYRRYHAEFITKAAVMESSIGDLVQRFNVRDVEDSARDSVRITRVARELEQRAVEHADDSSLRHEVANMQIFLDGVSRRQTQTEGTARTARGKSDDQAVQIESGAESGRGVAESLLEIRKAQTEFDKRLVELEPKKL